MTQFLILQGITDLPFKKKIELRGIVLLSRFYFLEDCHVPFAKTVLYPQKERFKDVPVFD
jgi:hypothetical protein